MAPTTVAAKDVLPGDEIYNPHAAKLPPCYWWNRVRLVEHVPHAEWSSGAIRIHLGSGAFGDEYTVKHPNEAVSVRRAANA